MHIKHAQEVVIGELAETMAPAKPRLAPIARPVVEWIRRQVIKCPMPSARAIHVQNCVPADRETGFEEQASTSQHCAARIFAPDQR